MANDMQQVILMTMPMPMPMHPDRQKFISYDQRPFTVGDRQPHVSIKPPFVLQLGFVGAIWRFSSQTL